MIFVLPSELEGLSLALLDAMGAGVCVLSSDVAENREAVAEAGFTFRSGDPVDLAERLRFLITNPTVREAAGEAAKRRVREHYQWGMIARQIEQIYLDMMGQPGLKAPEKKPSQPVATHSAMAEREAG